MAPLTLDRSTPRADGALQSYPVKAAVQLFAGSIGVIDATGFLTKGSVATTQKCVGRIAENYNNLAGANGAISGLAEEGTFRFLNSSAGDLIILSDVGADCFIVDDQTVAKTNGTNTRSRAGKIVNVDAQGVWVQIGAKF